MFSRGLGGAVGGPGGEGCSEEVWGVDWEEEEEEDFWLLVRAKAVSSSSVNLRMRSRFIA